MARNRRRARGNTNRRRLSRRGTRSMGRRSARISNRASPPVVVRSESTFQGVPPVAGASYLESFGQWWIVGLKVAYVIIGWILARVSTKEYATTYWKLKQHKDKVQHDNVAPPKSLDIGNATLLIPVACTSRAYVSIDNVLVQSSYVIDGLTAVPKGAPYPYDSLPCFQNYALTRFERYRLIELTIKVSSDTQLTDQIGRYHIGFSPLAVDAGIDVIRRSDERFPSIPTVDAIKNSQYYRELLGGRTVSISWRPRGYWKEWHQLGVGIEADAGAYSDAIAKVPWSWDHGGFGSRPFGELLMGHEVYAENKPEMNVDQYDSQRTSLRVSLSARVQLAGTAKNTQHPLTGVSNAESSSTVRVMRAYWVSSINKDTLNQVRFDSTRTMFIDKVQPDTLLMQSPSDSFEHLNI